MTEPENLSISPDSHALGERLISLNLLGLSPLLAVSNNLANSIVLGAATLLVSMLACLSCAVFREFYYHRWRLAVYLLILASYTSLVALLIERYLYAFHLQLGIYLPLICCNSALLVTMETKCRQQKPLEALRSGLGTGMIFLGIICVFGLIREWLTVGSLASLGEFTLFSQTSDTGESVAAIDADLISLHPGAFILLGLLVAAWNAVARWRRNSTASSVPEDSVEPVKRVRIVLRP